MKPVHQPVGSTSCPPSMTHKITDASPGETAILSAYFGGAGHEFIALIEKEVKNLLSRDQRVRERRTAASTAFPDLPSRARRTSRAATPGCRTTRMALQAGGAVLLKGKKIELGAIVRGPFTTTPFATDIVFAINRGAGAQIGPAFASRPGITPDALVTVTVGPYGQDNSATLTDLTTGTTEPISAPISVAGPTVRILLPAEPAPLEGIADQEIPVRRLDREPGERPDPGRRQLHPRGFDDSDRGGN